MLSIRDAIVFIILFGSNLLQAITGFAGIKIFEIFPLHQLLILYGIMIIVIALKKLLFTRRSIL